MSSERLWSLRFAQILLIESTLQFGMYTTRPIISNYALSLGASMALAGFLAGLLATAALATRPLSGTVSDRLSKRTLLVISCGLFAASALGCALCHTLWLLGVFLAIQGFAFAFKSTLVVSLTSLIVPKSRIGAGVGFLGVAYTVAGAVGPAVGSAISKSLGYSAVFAVSSAMLFAGFVLAVLLRLPKREGARVGATDAGESAGAGAGAGEAAGAGAGAGEAADSGASGGASAADDKVANDSWARGGSRSASGLSKYLHLPTLPLALIAGILMVAQGITSSFILVVGDMRGIEAASTYFLFYSLATLGARPLAGKVSDKHGLRWAAVPTMAIAAAGMFIAASVDSLWGIIVLGIFMGAGHGSAYCAIQAESVRGVPKSQLGRAANTFYIGPDLSMGLGPVAGGMILQSFGTSALFAFNGCFILIALAALLVFTKMKPSARP